MIDEDTRRTCNRFEIRYEGAWLVLFINWFVQPGV